VDDPSNGDSIERKGALEALRESEERYRLLFDRSPLPMWVYDQETLGFLAVNQAAVDHYGYSRDQFGSMTIDHVRPPEDLAASEERPIAAKGEGPSIWRHRKANGETIDVELTSHALEFSGRRARLVIANDVTERVRSEDVLRESESRYRLLAENATDMIVRLTLDGRRVYDEARERLAAARQENRMAQFQVEDRK